MSDDNSQQYQNSLSALTRPRETGQENPENKGTYSGSIDSNEYSGRKEYSIKRTTFGKIRYVQK